MRVLTGCAALALLAGTVAKADTVPPAGAGETIVVTATRSKQPLETVAASITVRELDELRRNGFTFGSDEYRGVPGVFFRRGEGDGDEFAFISFRGSTGTEGSLSLIDGIPIVGLYEEIQLNEIPYDAIERIEIVKGPVSALYGRGALYGATNYLTRSIEEDSIVARGTAGSDDYYRGEATLQHQFGNGGGLLFSGAYEDYGGWREQGARRIWTLFGKGEVPLGDAVTLTAYASYNDRGSELPNGRALDARGALLPFEGGNRGFFGFGEPLNESQNLFTAAKLEFRPSDELTFDLTGSWRSIDRAVFLNFFDPFGRDLSRGVIGINGFRGDTSQDVLFGEATVRWERGRHSLIAGFSAERSKIREDIAWTGQNGFTPECGFTFYLIELDARTGQVLNADHPCFVRDDPLTRTRFTNDFWGAFIQDEIALGERWQLTLGGRYDSFKRRATFAPIPGKTDGGDLDGSANAFSPKATLSYRPDWGQVYVAYGRGFASNFGATFEWDPVQYARPETRPTTIDSVELGFKGRVLDDTLRFEAAVYYSRQKNRRQIIPNPAAEEDFTQPFSLVTFGDLYESKGAEVSLNVRPLDGTLFTVNYSYTDPVWKDYVIETFGGPVDFSGNTPVGVPRHMVYVQADQRITDWLEARAILEFYDDYFVTVDNSFKAGGYELVTLNARISPPSWKGIALDLTLMNALDRTYYSFFGGRDSPSYAMPGPPRQFRAALTARF